MGKDRKGGFKIPKRRKKEKGYMEKWVWERQRRWGEECKGDKAMGQLRTRIIVKATTHTYRSILYFVKKNKRSIYKNICNIYIGSRKNERNKKKKGKKRMKEKEWWGEMGECHVVISSFASPHIIHIPRIPRPPLSTPTSFSFSLLLLVNLIDLIIATSINLWI